MVQVQVFMADGYCGKKTRLHDNRMYAQAISAFKNHLDLQNPLMGFLMISCDVCMYSIMSCHSSHWMINQDHKDLNTTKSLF